MSKCQVCRGPAVIDLPRHNANFCAEHLQQLCRRQVEKAIADHDMLRAGGARARRRQRRQGLPGACGTCSSSSATRPTGCTSGSASASTATSAARYARDFADERGLRLRTIDLRDEHGYDVPTAAQATRRVPCSACGLSKRHLFDAAAREGGYDVVATGHNLDDEAAVLLGNTLRWDVDYLARQLPVLPGGDGFPRKVKPLVRLTERETAAWCIVRGIDYQVEECPMAAGNKHLGYKATLNQLEARSPGSKASFYLGFVERHGAAAGRPLRAPPIEGLGAVRHAAARRRPTRCARSAASSRSSAAHEPVPVEMRQPAVGRR